MILIESCDILTSGKITLSHNTAFGKNIMSLKSCSVLFKGLITISNNYLTDSIMLFERSDTTFDNKIMFASNSCDKIITVKSVDKEYPYIKIMQHASVTFFDNKYSDNLLTIESNNDNNHPYPFAYSNILVQ